MFVESEGIASITIKTNSYIQTKVHIFFQQSSVFMYQPPLTEYISRFYRWIEHLLKLL